jgi:AcrR family transcriptional regulator
VPRPKQRTDALRERALASALAVLDEEGVAGLTTRTVARRANASVPAIYEVFGDKSGLIREVFFEGFRMLGDDLAAVPQAASPLEGLRHLADAFREFIVANPVLAEIMFSRPFADFDPGPEELAAGEAVRDIFLDRIRRCLDEGALAGDAVDIAHVLLAMAKGLAVQEAGCWLGTTARSVERRWRLGVHALLAGFAISV